MREFEISAATRDWKLVVVGASESAAGALDMLRGALAEYPRAWVTTDCGDEVPILTLIELAANEDSRV